MERNTIICGDALEVARTLPDESLNCIITSPPYFGLRDYGINGQIGLEDTPQQYVASLIELFDELKRVLRDDGTLWLNLGDTYTGGGRGDTPPLNTGAWKQGTNNGSLINTRTNVDGLPAKSLLGISWRVAFALQDAGWILRSDIIWSKPNPMPESVTDRPTKAHEYIFLLSKSPRYYYDADAIKEPSVMLIQNRFTKRSDHPKGDLGRANHRVPEGGTKYNGRNKRTVWEVTTKPFHAAHFATFPEDLVEPMILAGCPKGGLVYDPFMGAGTTALVAQRLGRDYLGSELNPEYIKIANERLYAPAAPKEKREDAPKTLKMFE